MSTFFDGVSVQFLLHNSSFIFGNSAARTTSIVFAVSPGLHLPLVDEPLHLINPSTRIPSHKEFPRKNLLSLSSNSIFRFHLSRCRPSVPTPKPFNTNTVKKRNVSKRNLLSHSLWPISNHGQHAFQTWGRSLHRQYTNASAQASSPNAFSLCSGHPRSC